MSLAQGNNTPTRPRIEPGSPDPESDALTTKPVRPPQFGEKKPVHRLLGFSFVSIFRCTRLAALGNCGLTGDFSTFSHNVCCHIRFYISNESTAKVADAQAYDVSRR